MKDAELLEQELKKALNMNAARINFIACFIVSLLKVCTVNFKAVAAAFPGKTSLDSNYKRIQRFFRFFPLNFETVAKFLSHLLPSKDAWFVVIDRTNWKFGKININILTLGVCHIKIAFPLLWEALPKKGNSNTNERIRLIDRFIKIFGTGKVKCLLADREFIGTGWFGFLTEHGIVFRIRVKENFIVPNSKGIPVPVKILFRHLKCGEYLIIKDRRKIPGHHLFITGAKLPTGEYLIIVTNAEHMTALEDYKKRWQIETLFACLKTRGFNFESTHLSDLKRIEKLVALLAIGFCWCHLTGEWLNEQKEINLKKHGRKSISIFRCGLDKLRNVLFNLQNNIVTYKKLVCFFSGNYDNNLLLLNMSL